MQDVLSIPFQVWCSRFVIRQRTRLVRHTLLWPMWGSPVSRHLCANDSALRALRLALTQLLHPVNDDIRKPSAGCIEQLGRLRGGYGLVPVLFDDSVHK